MKTSMPLCDGVLLQRADHLQAGAVADVGQAGVAVAAEVALQDAGRLWCGRTARPIPRARARGRATSWAWICAMRQLLSSLPPRMVSRKCTFQLSSG